MLKHIAKNQKQLTRAINQSKIRQVRRSAVYKFGFLIPKDYKQALQLDEQNGNSKWYDATKLEMDQINEYKVFQDHGKSQYDPKSRKVSNAPNGYQKIRVHLIFAVKHDGRHKARLVAGGHLTPDPIESIYSAVVSIRSLRLVIFLAKLNNLEVWGADIGNAYLEAKTKEKYQMHQMDTRKSGSTSSLLSNMMADTKLDWLLEDISLQILLKASTQLLSLSDPLGWSYS